MKAFIISQIILLTMATAFAQEEITSISFKGCSMVGSSSLSGDQIVKGLTLEKAKSASQYNDIAANKIRGMCELTVTAINGKPVGNGALCSFTSDVSRTKFDIQLYIDKTRKNCGSTGCAPKQVVICKGTAICEGHPVHADDTYNVTCIGDENGCPNVEDCMADEFTMPEEDISKAIQNKLKPTSATQQ